MIYSDGLIEQTNKEGEPFEKDRAKDILAATDTVADDVGKLFTAVHDFAGPYLDDDTTVASIELQQ